MRRSDTEQQLLYLIAEAYELMDRYKGGYTEAAELALRNKVGEAEETISNNGAVPFIRNRKFIYMGREQMLQFATERYTMTASFTEEGKVYGNYGLRPCVEWFRKQIYILMPEEEIKRRKQLIILKATDFLEHARPGAGIWSYPDEKIAELQKRLRNMSEKNEPEYIIACYNAYRRAVHSRILSSDIFTDNRLIFDRYEQKRMRERVSSNSELRQRYAEMVQQSELCTKEEIGLLKRIRQNQAGYFELNKILYVWNSTARTVNFKVPEGAKFAKLRFRLPVINNTKNNFGKVWIDNVSLISADRHGELIVNGGFEMGGINPKGWHPVVFSGRPELRREFTAPYCGTEKASVYIENIMNGDEGGWEYEELLQLRERACYTLIFDAKIDGEMETGLLAEIVFYDAEEQKLENFVYEYNRKSVIRDRNYLYHLQCNAFRYFMEGKDEHAVKAKEQILYLLNDFCQGAEYWLVKNERPERSDAYGAVQGGRTMACIAAAYSFIKAAEVWKTEEKIQFYKLTEYILHYLMDLRDRTEMSEEEVVRGCSNWQTDMCMGLVLMMLVLDDFPNRKAWMYSANEVLRVQLKRQINQDGSVPESLRYHFASLYHFSMYAKVWKNMTGEDWFRSKELLAMFRYCMHMQTPLYRGYIGTPPFGDHVLTDGNEYAVFGMYIKEIAKVDKVMADQLYQTWDKAGRPVKSVSPEDMVIQSFFIPPDDYQVNQGNELILGSETGFRDSGIIIFRRGYDTREESYLAIMSSPRKIGHGHCDQGAFILFHERELMIMDSGIEGYFDATTQWHLSSYSHACMQFADLDAECNEKFDGVINLSAGSYSSERGWKDTPDCSDIKELYSGDHEDTIILCIKEKGGRGIHTRKITADFKNACYRIEDKVKNYNGKILFSLPVVAKNCSIFKGISEPKVLCQGYGTLNMEVVIGSLHEEIWVEEGRCAPFFPDGSGPNTLQYIRIIADATQGFNIKLNMGMY